MVVPIAGERMYLWRTAEHEGEVLDMLLHRRCDTRAALRLPSSSFLPSGVAPMMTRMHCLACISEYLI